MNNTAKTTIVATIVLLVTTFATSGKALIEAANAAWLFLLKITEDAPLGLSSFLLAMALGVAAQPFVRRYIAVRCPHSRDFIADSSALLMGVGVMWLQLRTLDGLLLGLLAGFSAPLVFRGLAALCGLGTRALKKKQAELGDAP